MNQSIELEPRFINLYIDNDMVTQQHHEKLSAVVDSIIDQEYTHPYMSFKRICFGDGEKNIFRNLGH